MQAFELLTLAVEHGAQLCCLEGERRTIGQDGEQTEIAVGKRASFGVDRAEDPEALVAGAQGGRDHLSRREHLGQLGIGIRIGGDIVGDLAVSRMEDPANDARLGQGHDNVPVMRRAVQHQLVSVGIEEEEDRPVARHDVCDAAKDLVDYGFDVGLRARKRRDSVESAELVESMLASVSLKRLIGHG
jgi:hypothetical protein